MAKASQGGTAPFSVSQTVSAEPNVTEKQIDGWLLLKWSKTGIILYVLYLSTVMLYLVGMAAETALALNSF